MFFFILLIFIIYFSGEYWVVGVDVEQYDPDDPEKYLRGLLKNNVDPITPKAFQSYLGIAPSPPRNIENFNIQVNHYLQKPPFNFPNPLVLLGGQKKVSFHLFTFFFFFIIY